MRTTNSSPSLVLRSLVAWTCVLFWTLTALAAADPGVVPFSSPRWKFEAKEAALGEYLGRPALRLEQGMAWLPDAAFSDGIIEFDIAVSRQRGFSGVAFRIQGPGDFEHFYIRPHQSGNPDANQYTPEFHGLSAWQLYYGPDYSAPTVYQFEQWMHVRILISGRQAEVYLDSEEPVLFIPELKRDPGAGGIGLRSAMAPAHFANFRFETKPVELRTPPKARSGSLPGAVRQWAISSAFSSGRLGNRLTPAQYADLRWRTLPAEASGVTNLARVQGITGQADTAFARVTIHSARAQTRRLRFGFSDRARVYFNGELLYAGDDRYASRDYRFLGTMGLFDEVPLRLRQGPNEVWIAVSEEFGGWGVMAALDSVEGVRVEVPQGAEP